MPIYEYECPRCGKIFEKWGRAADSHKEEPCPLCGASSPRVISRTSFILKGNGWYVSDYGYRKGISEDSGGKADVPVPATPVSPAKQGEKAVAKIPEKPKAAKPAEAAPATAAATAAPETPKASTPAESKPATS